MNLETLKQKFSAFANIGNLSDTFQVKDADGNFVEVTLQTLLPEEDVDIQRYASEAFSSEEGEGSGTGADLNVFFDRFRAATLGFALIKFGGETIPDLIETGETFERDGEIIHVSRPRHEVMREEISTWSRTFVSRIFEKYGDLTVRAERQAESALEYDPKDYDEEISYHQSRLKELEERKKRAEVSEELRQKKVDERVEVQSQSRSRASQQAIEKAQRIQEEQRAAQLQKARRPLQPVVKPSSEDPAEPTPEPAPKPTSARQPLRPVIKPETAKVVVDRPEPQFEPEPRQEMPVESIAEENSSQGYDPDSSMVNFDDPDAVEQAILAEEQKALARVLEQERQQAATVAARKQVPPHKAAQQTARNLDSPQYKEVAQMPGKSGEKIPVFSMGSQVLSERNQKSQREQPPASGGARQPINPKFVGNKPGRR